MSVLFHNNATTTLSAGASDSATSISVVDGSAFPAISGSDYLYLTLEADSDSSLKEIVKCTARSGNTLTVVRGQDNSTARSFSSGDKCELRLTAAGLNDVATQADTETTYSVHRWASWLRTILRLQTTQTSTRLLRVLITTRIHQPSPLVVSLDYNRL